MYPVSEAFLQAVQENTRRYYWTGKITTIKGAGTNTAKTGRCTGAGVFAIMEVKAGKGSDVGWGRLKSGSGWISLDYCKRV